MDGSLGRESWTLRGESLQSAFQFTGARVAGSRLGLPGREVARLGLEGYPTTITNADLLIYVMEHLAGADAFKKSAPAQRLDTKRVRQDQMR